MKLSIRSNSNIYILLVILGLILNMLFKPQFIVAQVFALIYMAIIFKFFNTNFKHVQLFTLLLFGIINSNIYFTIRSTTVYFYYLVILVYLLYALVTAVKHKVKLSLSKPSLVFLGILLYMIFAIFISQNRGLAISSLKGELLVFAVFIAFFAEFKNIEFITSLGKFYLYLLVGVLFLGLLQISTINLGLVSHFKDYNVSAIAFPHIVRVPFTFFFNPNNYSLYLVVSLLVLAGNIVYGKNRQTLLIHAALYLVCLINLIFAMSRTSWITLLMTLGFGILFYLFKFKRDKQKFLRSAAIFISTIVIIQALSYLPFMQPYYGKMAQVQSMIEESGTDNSQNAVEIGKKGSINIRTTLIEDVIRGVVKDRHYFGFGPGNTGKFIQQLDNTFGITNVHSFWLEILGDYGIFMFVFVVAIYLYLCVKVLLNFIKTQDVTRKWYSYALGLVLFSLIFLSFAPSTVMNIPIFWIYFGGAAGFAVGQKSQYPSA